MNLTATIFGQSIAFIIFVMFCMKYVWPPIMKAISDRQKNIADGIAATDRANRDLQLAQEKAGLILRETKKQAAQLVDQANKRAIQILDEAKAEAKIEGARLIEVAKADAGREFIRARERLREEVGLLAVSGAERILGGSVDQKVQSQLVAQLASEL